MNDIEVKKSKIIGKGVFALRDFKKGEVVLKWNPKSITKAEAENLPSAEKNYVLHRGRKFYIMQDPERFVNYSCESNTFTKDFSDIASRDIKKGEEITTTHDEEDINAFECRCGSKKCKTIIK